MNSKIQTIVKRLPLLAAILGMSLAMASSAKRVNHKNSKYSGVGWFSYSGGSSSGDEHTATNYTYVSDNEPNSTGCNGSNRLCLVKMNYTGTGSTIVPEIPAGNVRDNVDAYYLQP